MCSLVLQKKEVEDMLIEIDFNSPQAIYIQLRNQIVMGIAQERLRDGDSLPSVRSLANTLGVNMHTVNKAYAMLRSEGYLILDRRKGAVIQGEVENKNAEIEKINHNLRMVVAQAICKGISREDMHAVIDDMYEHF